MGALNGLYGGGSRRRQHTDSSDAGIARSVAAGMRLYRDEHKLEKMSQTKPNQISDQYPIGCKVMYSNCGARGDGNVATVKDYLYRHYGVTVAYIELQFESGGNHVVTVKQIKKYYSKIS